MGLTYAHPNWRFTKNCREKAISITYWQVRSISVKLKSVSPWTNSLSMFFHFSTSNSAVKLKRTGNSEFRGTWYVRCSPAKFQVSSWNCQITCAQIFRIFLQNKSKIMQIFDITHFFRWLYPVTKLLFLLRKIMCERFLWTSRSNVSQVSSVFIPSWGDSVV